MIKKNFEKSEAISLRKQGYSYSEIIQKVSVAKSTLSIWLRSVKLAKKQKQILTNKKIKAALKGSLMRKKNRILLTKEIRKKAIKEVGCLSKRELWLIGVSLYWAEGSKEKFYHPGSGVEFINSDPYMLKIFLRWLKICCGVKKDQISFEICIHQISLFNIANVKQFWSKSLGVSLEEFNKIRYKNNKITNNRKKNRNVYNGLVRIRVKASSKLLRKISGWITGIYS